MHIPLITSTLLAYCLASYFVFSTPLVSSLAPSTFEEAAMREFSMFYLSSDPHGNVTRSPRPVDQCTLFAVAN